MSEYMTIMLIYFGVIIFIFIMSMLALIYITGKTTKTARRIAKDAIDYKLEKELQHDIKRDAIIHDVLEVMKDKKL